MIVGWWLVQGWYQPIVIADNHNPWTGNPYQNPLENILLVIWNNVFFFSMVEGTFAWRMMVNCLNLYLQLMVKSQWITMINGWYNNMEVTPDLEPMRMRSTQDSASGFEFSILLSSSLHPHLILADTDEFLATYHFQIHKDSLPQSFWGW